MASSDKRYWADEREQSSLIRRCMERVDWHLDALNKSGRLEGMSKSLSSYYGSGVDGARTARSLTDVDDSTVEMHVNITRPVVTNVVSLICGQWPKTKPRATNDSAKSLAETRLAMRLHDAYQDKSSAKSRIVDTVRGGVIASAWSLGHAWAPQDGKEWDTDAAGQPVYEGDAINFVLPPWRCVWDFAASDESGRKWVLFKRPTSRWDAAANVESRAKSAQDPKEQERLMRLAESIRNSSETDVNSAVRSRIGNSLTSQISGLEFLLGEALPAEDTLWVWELRHLPTPALPSGRLVRFFQNGPANGDVLFDSLALGTVYPYDAKELHVREYSPERVVTGSGGHTAAFDLGGLQEFHDLCTASMASTININGQNRFWSGGEEGVNVRDLGINGAVVESKTKPEVLNFPALKPEVVQAADWSSSKANASMALNDVVMGNPSKGMPAQAMALLKATAIQYHAVAQGEFVRLVKWDANSRLRLFKRFARAKRTSQLVGKAATYELEQWSSADIAGVEGFEVEEVDPATDARETRLAMADMLLQRNLISAESYICLIQTGSLQQGLETKTAQKEMIEANVELLQSGVGLPPVDMAKTQEALMADPAAMPVFTEPPEGKKTVRILKSDPHHLAVPAYLGVLTSPSSRGDADRMKACLEAVQLSMQYWAALTPDEGMAYGIPPLPSQMAMMGDAPPGMPPEGPSDAKPEGGAPQGPMPDAATIEQPEDPSTGEQVPGAPTQVG